MTWRRNWLSILSAMLLSAQGAMAQMSAAEAFNAGKVAGGESVRSDVQTNVTHGGAEGTIRGYSTSPPSATSYWMGSQTPVGPIVSGGSALESACSTGTLPSDPAEAQRCAAIRAINKSAHDRAAYGSLIGKDDPLILRGNAITADPEAVAGTISGAYTACTTSTQTRDPVFEYETCDEALTNAAMTCSIGQEVVVDADHFYQCVTTLATLNSGQCTVGTTLQVARSYNYQCQQSPKSLQTYTCNRILTVTCDALHDGCDDGGIVMGSTQADMRVWFGPWGGGTYALEFGTFRDNYWASGTYDRTLTFSITDKDKITAFSLARASYDDWLWVKVNGNTVYIGPRGGNTLYVVNSSSNVHVTADECNRGWAGTNYICYRWVNETYQSVGSFPYCTGAPGNYTCNTLGQPGSTVNYGTGVGPTELATSWNFSLNIDLRPYLQNGANQIWTRTIVAGGGESAIRIWTRMLCPRTCYDNWDNQCQAFEARAQ